MYLSIEEVKTNPVFKRTGFDHVELNKVVKALSLTRSAVTDQLLYADRYALSFYALNHLFSGITTKKLAKEPLDPIEAQICTMYEDTIAEQARFVFAYLVFACVREARHVTDLELPAPVSIDVATFFSSIMDMKAKAVADHLVFSDINCTLGEFLKVLNYQFSNSGYSNGFGGLAWGDIAECCENFAVGKISAEVFLDLAYHLEHNNGSVFNKNFIFSDDKPDLKKVLDVQASGQTINLIKHPSKGNTDFISKVTLNKEIAALIPESTPPVNWDKVFKGGKPHKGKYINFLEATDAIIEDTARDAVAVPNSAEGAINSYGGGKFQQTGIANPYHDFHSVAHKIIREV
ncbi:hypothetical protein NVP1215B_009 [Vibrio phage 1.215.B._10N.222.54.F7]|nr:hypothetical protein NVP1215A_009 [Vibrio phage 1.215.A._10N.222.54.F7]AUR96032.1 hypothetical protein NVP1215B_009 [Vibrio phage 1.215.B._10N.222.54.F7]